MDSDLLSEKDFKLFKSMDNIAFKLVYEKYYRLINYIANRCGADSAMCDDIVQETFIRLYDHTDQIQNSAHIKNWLSTTARNLSMDKARKRAVENKFAQHELQTEQQNENNRLANQATFSSDNDIHELELRLIGKLIDQITTDTNDNTFSLFYRDGYSAKQIATQMNVPVSTITNRLSRTRKRFQRYFEQHLKNLHEHIL